MARSDIYRRERQVEPVTEEAPTDDMFYESMPMAAQPSYRESTTVIQDTGETVEGRATNFGERLVSYIIGLVEAVLALRLLLSVFSYLGVITTANEFARIIYQFTNPLVAPFSGLFNAPYADPGAWTIAFAMLVYAIIGYAITGLFRLGRSRR